MKLRGPGFAPHPGQPLFFKKNLNITQTLLANTNTRRYRPYQQLELWQGSLMTWAWPTRRGIWRRDAESRPSCGTADRRNRLIPFPVSWAEIRRRKERRSPESAERSANLKVALKFENWREIFNWREIRKLAEILKLAGNSKITGNSKIGGKFRTPNMPDCLKSSAVFFNWRTAVWTPIFAKFFGENIF
jgi:hypothetical protein